MRRSRLSVRALRAWAELNGIKLNGVTVEDLENGQGAGLVASRDIQEEDTVFVSVPKELVLSKDLVWEYARSDPHLRQVLEAMDDYAKVAKAQSVLEEYSLPF
jgi:hypothetical protein